MLVRACDGTVIYPRANGVAEERQHSAPVTEISCALHQVRPLVPPLPRWCRRGVSERGLSASKDGFNTHPLALEA